MKDLRELFIKYLTEDIEPNKASAIFDGTGKPLWSHITLEMVLSVFDKAMEDYK